MDKSRLGFIVFRAVARNSCRAVDVVAVTEISKRNRSAILGKTQAAADEIVTLSFFSVLSRSTRESARPAVFSNEWSLIMKRTILVIGGTIALCRNANSFVAKVSKSVLLASVIDGDSGLNV